MPGSHDSIQLTIGDTNKNWTFDEAATAVYQLILQEGLLTQVFSIL